MMLAGRFDDDVVAWHGVLQSAAVHEFHESHGVLIEATSTPPGMGSMVFPGYGAELLGWLDRASQVATFGAMVADRGVGSVSSVRGETLVRYNIARGDAAKLLVAIEAMGRLLFAAGAVEVLTGLPGAMTVTSLPALRDALSRSDPQKPAPGGLPPNGHRGRGRRRPAVSGRRNRPAARRGRRVGCRRVDPAELPGGEPAAVDHGAGAGRRGRGGQRALSECASWAG